MHYHMERSSLSQLLNQLQIELQCARLISCTDGWRCLDYKRDIYKLYYIQSGQGWIKIGDQEYWPIAGDLVLLPAQVVQSYSHIGKDFYTKYFCHFQANVGSVPLFNLLSVPYVLPIGKNDFVEDRFKDLITLNHASTYSEMLRCQSALLDLLAFYIEKAYEQGGPRIQVNKKKEHLSQLYVFIDKHLHKSLSVQDLASHLHLHPNYLMRMFKEETGESLISFINKQRISRARSLLMTTRLPISTIAKQVGFNNSHYFSKLFRQYTRLTPREYRGSI